VPGRTSDSSDGERSLSDRGSAELMALRRALEDAQQQNERLAEELAQKREPATAPAGTSVDPSTTAVLQQQVQVQIKLLGLLESMQTPRRARGRSRTHRGTVPTSFPSPSWPSTSFSSSGTTSSVPSKQERSSSVPSSRSLSRGERTRQAGRGQPAAGRKTVRTQRPPVERPVAEVEQYDRRLRIRAANTRFRSLLDYRTYFVLDTRLAYPPWMGRKAQKVNKSLDGGFQGIAPFTGADPLAVFTFLSTFKRACGASCVCHGQALVLLGFRLAGQAKRSLASATASRAARDRYAIHTYGDAINWLLQKYATPDLLNKAYQDIIVLAQGPAEAPRLFAERVEQQCDRLDGLFRTADVADVFVIGLHPEIKAQVMEVTVRAPGQSLPETVTTPQINWDGMQKLKEDLHKAQRTALRGVVHANVVTPSGEAPGRDEAESFRGSRCRPSRSPSPVASGTQAELCYVCRAPCHFARECPTLRPDRSREEGPPTVVAAPVVDDEGPEWQLDAEPGN